MKSQLIYSLLLGLVTASASFAQTSEEAVLKVVNRLFEGMRQGDSTMVRTTFHPKIKMGSTMLNREGKPTLHTEESPINFLKTIGTPHDKVYDERLFSPEVRIDGPLATVWARYEFYVGDQFSHCGYDSFQLVNTPDAGWKILFLIDTRQRQGCDKLKESNREAELNALLDAWHRAAATADEVVFFGTMAEDGVYLGTDQTERWVRPEFEAWSKKYFERDTAWDFKPFNRHLTFTPDGRTAYFDELLNTWMGVCRGSGVLELSAKGWKIKQYNLAVMVPNEKINGFIELVSGKKPPKRKKSN